MHQSIRYLEAMGQNPSLMRLSASQLERLMNEMELDDAARVAIANEDVLQLKRVTGVTRHMSTNIWAPGEDPYARPGEEPAGDFIPVENYRPES